MENFKINDIYNTEFILKERNINREAFYSILQILKISDRDEEYRFLQFILTQNKDDLHDIAETFRKVKIQDKKTPRRRRYVSRKSRKD